MEEHRDPSLVEQWVSEWVPPCEQDLEVELGGNWMELEEGGRMKMSLEIFNWTSSFSCSATTVRPPPPPLETVLFMPTHNTTNTTPHWECTVLWVIVLDWIGFLLFPLCWAPFSQRIPFNCSDEGPSPSSPSAGIHWTRQRVYSNC